MKNTYGIFVGITVCLWLASAKAQEESDFRFYTNYLDTTWEVWSTGQAYTNALVPGSIFIMGYQGPPTPNVTIPSTITGRPVTWIYGFQEDTFLVNLTISEGIVGIRGGAVSAGHQKVESIMFPGSLTNIEVNNFSGVGHSSKHVGLYFGGNAPSVDSTVFQSVSNATVYYLPGTTGWGATLKDSEA